MTLERSEIDTQTMPKFEILFKHVKKWNGLSGLKKSTATNGFPLIILISEEA
jgi:hypothetical protein